MIDPDICPHPETIDSGDGWELCISCGEDLPPAFSWLPLEKVATQHEDDLREAIDRLLEEAP